MTTTFDDLLALMGVNTTAFVGKNLTAPWNILIEEQQDLWRFHLIIKGKTWLSTAAPDSATLLQQGDLAIVPFGKAHYYYDDPGRKRAQVLMLPAPAALPRFERLELAGDETHMLCGYFKLSERTPPALLAHMPEMIVARARDSLMKDRIEPLTALIETELKSDQGPAQLTLNKLTEILCVTAMGAWARDVTSDNLAMAALADPKTKQVLEAIHLEPSKPWDVDSLAALVGRSRTAFTTKFRQATGMTPIKYIRQWRILQARTMLETSDMALDEIAFRSGYADTNAFNRAFRRETGLAPGAYRRSMRGD